jgi:zinc protease
MLRVMKRVFGSLLVLLCATAGAPAAADAPPKPAASPGAADPGALMVAEKTRLANGLEVILHEDHRTPIVSVNIYYHVGSKDEPRGRNGFAHLFEHVMFQGSKHVPEDKFFQILERAGATDVNGTTNDDRTNYFETVPANRLELALWLESDRMGFLLDHADQATFESQRDVVKNERRQNYENAPYGLVGQFIRSELYPEGHPYRLQTIGTPQDLDAARLDDVKAFFRTWYVPNNASLVVAGDIDKKKTLELVEKFFGPIPGAKIPARKAPPKVELTGVRTMRVSAAVELPRVTYTWPTPAYFLPGDAELDLVAHILTSGKTSRLYKRLVYDLQIAQDVSAGQGSMEWGSSFSITTTLRAGKSPDEAARIVDEELTKLMQEGPTAAELTRAKTSITASFVYDIERNGGRANHINAYNHYTNDPNYIGKDMMRYGSATENAIRDAAARYLPLGKRIVTVVTPDKSAPLAGRLDRVEGGGK